MSGRPASIEGASRSTVTIGIDVGGRTVKGLALDADGVVLATHRIPTPSPDPSGQAVLTAVVTAADRLGHRPGVALGVALPGIVDETRGMAVHSVNLGWRDLPMADLLADRLSAPVLMCHDVRAGAVAETRSGAARGVEGVVTFVAIGTGIAAAVLLDGVPVVAGGWAGEIGQLVLTDGPFRGRRVEEVASAAGTAARAGAPDARTVAAAVADGDAAAQEVWDETVAVLAFALGGLVAAVAPGVVVVGGGLALAGELLLGPLRRRLRDVVPGLRLPALVPARHGDAAAALGAAALAADGVAS